MLKLIAIAVVCGLVLSLFLSFGPGFWGLIQNSIRYGFRKGAAFEVGVNFSDIVMVVLLLTLLNNDPVTDFLRTPGASIVGGTVVIVFGLVTILRRPSTETDHAGRIRVVQKGIPRGRELALYGFTLNTLNPSVWLYWAALAAVVKSEIHLDDLHTFIFFISLLLAELSGGLLKCYLAAKLKSILSPRVMHKVNLVTGLILVGLGCFLIGSTVRRLRHPDRVEKEPTEVVTHIIHQSLMSKDSNQTAFVPADTLMPPTDTVF